MYFVCYRKYFQDSVLSGAPGVPPHSLVRPPCCYQPQESKKHEVVITFGAVTWISSFAKIDHLIRPLAAALWSQKRPFTSAACTVQSTSGTTFNVVRRTWICFRIHSTKIGRYSIKYVWKSASRCLASYEELVENCGCCPCWNGWRQKSIVKLLQFSVPCFCARIRCGTIDMWLSERVGRVVCCYGNAVAGVCCCMSVRVLGLNTAFPEYSHHSYSSHWKVTGQRRILAEIVSLFGVGCEERQIA
jgi:hypothetical protein